MKYADKQRRAAARRHREGGPEPLPKPRPPRSERRRLAKLKAERRAAVVAARELAETRVGRVPTAAPNEAARPTYEPAMDDSVRPVHPGPKPRTARMMAVLAAGLLASVPPPSRSLQ